MKDKIMSGVIGLCVADALGVPVEFTSRKSLMQNPVTDMRGYGTYNQPPGTWSDDTSMALCLLDSLANGLDYSDIMQKFLLWYEKAEYTPYGNVFDAGIATRKALNRFAQGTPALQCGGTSEYDNGNGSIMRILPLVFYLRIHCNEGERNDSFTDIIYNVSSLTHAHIRSLIACNIYLSIADSLLDAKDLHDGVYEGLGYVKHYYKQDDDLSFSEEFRYFSRIFSGVGNASTSDRNEFINLPQEEIKSSGYVVDTLESALWCLLNTDSYESCVLKAVNLGDDTDTVAAVAGGLAGIYYGIGAIPDKWVRQIARIDYIKQLCLNFESSILKLEHEYNKI